jgi:SOS response regulatory protein OraA/RecX
VTEKQSASKLMQKAGRLLARRDYSRGELGEKLSLVADECEVETVLQKLEQLDLLNDEHYAYNFAVNRMKRDGWGPLKVFHSLLRRRIASRLAESVIARVRCETGDGNLLRGYLRGFCGKHGLPQDRRSIQKLIARLRRRGFHDEIIYSVLRESLPAMAWRCFDTGE